MFVRHFFFLLLKRKTYYSIGDLSNCVLCSITHLIWSRFWSKHGNTWIMMRWIVYQSNCFNAVLNWIEEICVKRGSAIILLGITGTNPRNRQRLKGNTLSLDTMEYARSLGKHWLNIDSWFYWMIAEINFGFPLCSDLMLAKRLEHWKNRMGKFEFFTFLRLKNIRSCDAYRQQPTIIKFKLCIFRQSLTPDNRHSAESMELEMNANIANWRQ